MKNFESQHERIEQIITHDGVFHTDEVFATAILKDLFPESMELANGGMVDFVKYLRTRDKTILQDAAKSPNEMLVDVGAEHNPDNFNFDHHQKEGAGKRENGIGYASAGLVWKTFGRDWIKYVDVYSRKLSLTPEEIEAVWKLVDDKYVQLMDANDTGQLTEITYTLKDGTELSGGQFSLPEIVRLYNVDMHDGRSQQDRFVQAVDIFRNVALGMANKYMGLMEGIRNFELEKCEFSQDGKSAIFDQNIPPHVISYLVISRPEFKDVEFYGYRTEKGTFSVMPAPVQEESRIYRNPGKIPQRLRLGNKGAEISRLIGVPQGVLFCHTDGFFASCDDRETAEKFLAECVKG